MKKHNYSAGPCILPQEVFEEASKSILNFNNNSKYSFLNDFFGDVFPDC